MVLAIVAMLTFSSCRLPDQAIAEFQRIQPRVSEAIITAAAGTYMYRLGETPEEQAMQEITRRMQLRTATKADFGRAVMTERIRREQYIDCLETDIETAKIALADLAVAANAIKDLEVRTAAVALVRHYGEMIDACKMIARAQRSRSVLTESMFKSLMVNQIPDFSAAEFSRADREAEDARSRLEDLTDGDKILMAEFVGVRQRKGFSVRR